MTSLHSSMTIIFAEISIILAVLIGIIVVRYIRNQRHLKSCLMELAGKINGKRQDKLTMLQKLLEQTCQYSTEQAKETAAVLLEKEIRLYMTLIQIYLNQDHHALTTVDQNTDELISAYRDLLAIAAASINHNISTEPDERIQELAKTVNELTEKNNNLTQEIVKLNHDMDATVSEYTSVFHASSESVSDLDEITDLTETSSPARHTNDSQEHGEENNSPVDIADEEISNLEENLQQSGQDTTVIARLDDDELAQELNELAASLDEENTNPAIPVHELDNKPD